MSKQIRKRLFWNMVGTSGLIVGGMLALSVFLTYLFRADTSGVAHLVSNVVTFSAFVIVPFFLGKKFARKNALWGLTFQRALSYMLVMYILAGFIYGLSFYLIFNYDTEYFMPMIKASGLISGGDTKIIEETLKSPLKIAFASMTSMPFFSIMPALIISVLIKRNPAIRDYK